MAPSIVLFGLSRGQSLCRPAMRPDRVGPRVGPFGRRDQERQGEDAVVGPVEPAYLDHEAAEQPDVSDGQDRPGDRGHRLSRLMANWRLWTTNAPIMTADERQSGQARSFTGPKGS